MNARDEAVGEVERLHPAFLLSGLLGSLRGIAGAYALIAYLVVSGRFEAALAGVVGLFAVMAVGIFIYWRRFEYRVGADEIRIDSGVLSRTHRSIPFDRIQDVDISQSLVARVLGLAKVTFETGGGSAAPGKEEGVLHAITLQRAEELRRLVRARRSSATIAASEAVPEEESRPVYAMSLGRLLLSGTFNFSLALFAGLFGLTQTVGDFAGFDPLSPRFWNRALSAGDPVRNYILGHEVAAVAAGLVLLVLAGLVTGIFRTVVQDFGFRLDRTGVGLRRRRGLFTRTDVTLPAKRAQAALIASGPIREPLGFAELRIQNLAGDEDKSGTHVLAPLATGAEVDGILSELGWRTLPGHPQWHRVSTGYVWSRIVALTPLYLAAVAQGLLLRFAYGAVPMNMRAMVVHEMAPLIFTFLATVGAAVVAIATRWLAWRTTAYALDGDRLLVRTGWWKRRKTILPLAKIQSIDLRHSVVSRWFGVATLQFGVAGGNALNRYSIPDIPIAGAGELRDRLLGSAA